MSIISKYVKFHLKTIIFSSLLVIICSFVSIIPVKLTQQLIDYGFQAKDLNYIIICSACIGLSTIVKCGLSYISLQQFSKVGYSIVADMRIDIFDKVLNYPSDFFSGKDSGYLSSRINEISQISSLFSPNNVKFVSGLIEALFAITILGTMNWGLLLICCVPVVIYVSISIYSTKNYQKVIKDALEVNAQYVGKLNETINGQEEIRVNNGKQKEQEKIRGYSDKIKKRSINQTLLLGATTEILTVATSLVSILIYIVCGFFTVNGDLTIGEVIAFSQYTGKIYAPIISFSSVVLVVQPALLCIKRIKAAFFENIPTTYNGKINTRHITEVEVNKLCYNYPNRRENLIDNLSFSLTGPSLCYINGSNGSGKTTLSKILLKLIDGYSGKVLINGIELKEISESSYREECAAVSQKAFLFNDTIYNNIVYGLPNVTHEHYETVIKLSGLDSVLNTLPEGDRTVVGENGSLLSGGEKQKVSIARALLKNASLLILDEPSNNLDKESLSELCKVLEGLSRERIIIVIDHNNVFEDISTVTISM